MGGFVLGAFILYLSLTQVVFKVGRKHFNSLPNNKSLDRSTFKAFAENKVNIT